MRILVDIPNDQIKELALMSEAKKVSRAELIRQAISFYIGSNRQVPADAFGAWKTAGRTVDGVAYQKKVRSEW